MTKYEELQLAIAEKLCQVGGWARADSIVSIIAERCVFLDSKELPTNPEVPPKFNDLACGPEDDSDNISRSFYLLAQQDMLNAGWRPVKEIKKEA